MTTDVDALDRQRRRWRNARREFNMASETDERFALAPPGTHVIDLGARIVVLPRDPVASVVEFDDAFWKWFSDPINDPASGKPARWGTDQTASSSAAILFDPWSDGEWSRYLSVLHNGGIDIGLGRNVVSRYEKGAVFNVSRIVARLWCGLQQFQRNLERFQLQGPFEVAVGLVNTSGAVLGGFGEGWSQSDWQPSCPTPNVLLRREIDDICAGSTKALAFSLGGQVEDAFGCTSRRFLSRTGQFKDDFDPRYASW